MNHLVLIDFVDKESDVYFASGSFYACDDAKRVKELEKLGFIKANEESSSLEEVKEEEKPKVKRTRKKASE